MPDPDPLAGIIQRHYGLHGIFSTVTPADIDWLIAEIRRLRELVAALDNGKEQS